MKSRRRVASPRNSGLLFRARAYFIVTPLAVSRSLPNRMRTERETASKDCILSTVAFQSLRVLFRARSPVQISL
jgi:hypothetical protein